MFVRVAPAFSRVVLCALVVLPMFSTIHAQTRGAAAPPPAAAEDLAGLAA